MIVIMAEKPSVARDIARVLKVRGSGDGCITGNGYTVTWALGHLVTQCEPDEIDEGMKKWRMETLPFLPETIPNKVIPASRKQYQIVKKLFLSRDTEKIICATDAGREGELIFRRIYQLSGCKKPVERLWISSMTDEAIRQGFASLEPMSHYDSLYESALCRSDADYLVGINGSRAFTLRYGALLSVGRVQTPTLSLLVKRRREIEQFVPQTYYELEADFGAYKGTWTNRKEKTTHIEKKEEAEAIQRKTQGKPGVIAEVKKEEKRQIAPQLFDLTSLQQEANRRFGLTAAQTLNCAQALYEKYKVLTYPRTDARVLPRDMLGRVKSTLSGLPEPYAAFAQTALKGVRVNNTRIFNDEKVTDHHALVPTGKRAALPEREAKVFDLVVRRFLAAFFPPYVYEQCTVVTEVEGEAFVTTGRRTLERGWQAVESAQEAKPAARKKGAAKEEAPETVLPEDLAEGGEVTARKVELLTKSTNPPKPHTEASLLSAMENAGRQVEDESLREAMKESGLGTPATRAAIIERLLQVGYAVRKGRTLLATDKGVALIDAVPPELSSPETTGKWERALNRIRTGQMDTDRFMGSIRRFCEFLVTFAKDTPSQVRFEKEEYGARGRKPSAGKRTYPKKTAAAASGTKAEAKPAAGRRTAAGPAVSEKAVPSQKGGRRSATVVEESGQTAMNLPAGIAAAEKTPAPKRKRSEKAPPAENAGEQLRLF